MKTWGKATLITICLASLTISALSGGQERQLAPRVKQAAVNAPGVYAYALSSGPFSLPAGAQSVDWVVLNDSAGSQTVRVTVYKCGLGSAKTAVAPGAIETTLAAGTTTHNANSVGTVFSMGFIYEVVVETNDKRTLPCVVIWQDHGGTAIPGTLIPAGSFINIK